MTWEDTERAEISGWRIEGWEWGGWLVSSCINSWWEGVKKTIQTLLSSIQWKDKKKEAQIKTQEVLFICDGLGFCVCLLPFLFTGRVVEHWSRLPRRLWNLFIRADDQNTSRLSPGQPAVVDPSLSENWTIQPPEVPFSLILLSLRASCLCKKLPLLSAETFYSEA